MSKIIKNKELQISFNVEVIKEYLESDKKYEDLPELVTDVFVSDNSNQFKITGMHNSENNIKLSGFKMTIRPNVEYVNEIRDALKNSAVFPFDYYIVDFTTFDGRPYTSYNRYL